MMGGYGAKEVAKMLGLSVAQVRSYVKAGFLDPERGPRGELRFSFQDLVLLRTAKGLVSAKIPARRVKTALKKLRSQLPEGRTLRAVHIHAEGDEVVVADGEATFNPEGQVLFDFSARQIAAKTVPLKPRHSESAEDYYERALDLEEDAPLDAIKAYKEALRIDPSLADAWVNLGRLLHESGDPQSAAQHYQKAIELRPDDVIALFNLGVALTDLKMLQEAVLAYRTALAADAACADAHYNLAHLYERLGDPAAALRHLRSYRKLVVA